MLVGCAVNSGTDGTQTLVGHGALLGLSEFLLQRCNLLLAVNYYAE